MPVSAGWQDTRGVSSTLPDLWYARLTLMLTVHNLSQQYGKEVYKFKPISTQPMACLDNILKQLQS